MGGGFCSKTLMIRADDNDNAVVLITKKDFEALAVAHGFSAAHHQPGAYEQFHAHLQEALEETIAASMLSVPVVESTATDLPLGAAVRKRVKVYEWI